MKKSTVFCLGLVAIALVPASLPVHSQSLPYTLANFEAYGGADAATVLFRNPSTSGDTYGLDNDGPDFTQVRNVDDLPPAAAGNPAIGQEVMHVGFAFTALGEESLDNRYIRLRTVPLSPSIHNNPVISFEHTLQFDIYTTEPLEIALMARETDSTGDLGTDGGRSGSVKWLGADGQVGDTVTSGTEVPANVWVTLSFDIPALANSAIARTGSGPLESTTGKGVLEALAIIGEPGATYDVYLDNFVIVPEPSTYALFFGAAAVGFAFMRRRGRGLSQS